MIYSMYEYSSSSCLPDETRIVCTTLSTFSIIRQWHMLPGLDLYYSYADPAQPLEAVGEELL